MPKESNTRFRFRGNIAAQTVKSYRKRFMPKESNTRFRFRGKIAAQTVKSYRKRFMPKESNTRFRFRVKIAAQTVKSYRKRFSKNTKWHYEIPKIQEKKKNVINGLAGTHRIREQAIRIYLKKTACTFEILCRKHA